MRLPKSVQEIADVIGYFKALRFVRALEPCGSRDRRRNIYVPKPKNLTPKHQLVTMLGWDDAFAMCEEHGGRTLQPAISRYQERAILNDRRIVDYYDLAFTPAEIAVKLNISEKWAAAVVGAREMHDSGADIEVIAHSVKISPLTLGYILRINVNTDIGPVKRRGTPREINPQITLAL